MKDNFSTYHPIVNFIYFLTVICLGMFFMHPGLLCISAVFAFCYSVRLGGRKQVRFNLALLPAALVAAAVNLLFVHKGMTTLFYIGANPVILESILYGLTAGIMVIGIAMWCSCLSKVMTSDKIVYLFGRVLPSVSLIFSMSLRMVGLFTDQAKRIAEGQRALGRNPETLTEKIAFGLRVLSILVTWALENAIDTADSMKARGYGLPGRTAYNIFKFEKKDCLMLAEIAMLLAVIALGIAKGQLTMQFYPYTSISEPGWCTVTTFGAYVLLTALPLLTKGKEGN